MTADRVPPPFDVIEITLIGPGYGESIVLHIGQGKWIVVDSCEDETGYPQPLRYLADMRVDPASAVVLVVATHWHDDHIRGMGRLVDECRTAKFVCASAFTKHEFLVAVRALDDRRRSAPGSGLKELHSVFLTLRERQVQSLWAIADRLVLTEDDCKVWSLSPGDVVVADFLRSVCSDRAQAGQKKDRLPTLSPNRMSVTLWVTVKNIAALLGGDLPKKEWLNILEHCQSREGTASVFKVPHHGSPDADDPRIWAEMLETEPYAVLTPWHKGGKSRPTAADARRLLSYSKNAYATTRGVSRVRRSRELRRLVRRSTADTDIDLRSAVAPIGAIRLRRAIDKAEDWRVELFGGACHLTEYLDNRE